ncbi:ribosomal RNA-processing protein 8 isoform X2 [Ceratina calcarata]|uniref:Ribosomal RNA-processing protein 8 n=1 Tax=Ceratina calcarata TaxID=156304 RepID=A0AAJ7N2Y5_9HYME|nr:ribosomal RNA-processing protein 8 isoform X2 [Ceratina calcarata]
MAKKTTKGNKQGKKKNTQKNIKENQNEKPAVVNDRNLKFKSKNKKNKVAKKIKQIQKNEENRDNFLNSDVVEVVNVKKKGKDKRAAEFIQNKGKQEFGNSRQNKKKDKVVDQKKTGKVEKIAKKGKSKQEVKMNKEVDHKTAQLNALLEKKLKQQQKKSSKKKDDTNTVTKQHNLDVKKLEKMLANKNKERKKEKLTAKPQNLRHRMMSKLKSSRFRYLNEILYNNESSESKKLFKNDPDAFQAYHEGYKQQVEQWSLNPLDIIISSIKKMPKQYIIADFGCGEGMLAASVPHKVHSFDFVSLNKNVTVCDVAHTPLLRSGVNVVVFCLSLMGTNLNDYIKEANRVLKKDGILKIAEVESRFDQVDDFIKAISSYGFKCTWKDLSHNLFYFLDFVKVNDLSGKKNKLLPITLKPCLYKKR